MIASTPYTPSSGGCRCCEWRHGDADTLVGSIIDCVEALKESVAIDKVETRSRGSTNIVDDQVDAARTATNQRTQRARPNLRVRGELECCTPDHEVDRLKASVLRRGEAEQARGSIKDGSSRGFVAVERICASVISVCLHLDKNNRYNPQVAMRMRVVPESKIPVVHAC
jgi:hypothetical protein